MSLGSDSTLDVFFSNVPPTPEIYTLSLHDALPISNIATLLADLGEVDFRKLYVPASYSSMYLYCLYEHHMSEDMAYKRIQAARAARRFPAIFPAPPGCACTDRKSTRPNSSHITSAY